jgi:cell wall assembly regulator SMI1
MKMIFTNPERSLSQRDITKVEKEFGLTFPAPVRKFYAQWNGGSPEPYMYQDDTIDTVVAELLPLKSSTGRGEAGQTYQRLVLEKQIVPKHYFPFAVDGGGDYFFVDCSDPAASIYFFRSEHWLDDRERCFVKLPVSFDEFWLGLKPDEMI